MATDGSGTFTNIGPGLWAGYRPDGRFFAITAGRDPGRPENELLVEVDRLGDLLRAITRRPTADVLTSGVPSPRDRLATLEAEQTRIENAHDRAISELKDETAGFRRELDQAYARGGDAKAVVDEARTLSARTDALEKVIADLLAVVGDVQSGTAELHAAIERAQTAPAAPAIPPDVATRDFVDEAIKRLNGALRDHVSRTLAQALRAAQPAPGLLQRLVTAARAGGGRYAAAVHQAAAVLDPERAAAIGAAAARAKAATP